MQTDFGNDENPSSIFAPFSMCCEMAICLLRFQVRLYIWLQTHSGFIGFTILLNPWSVSLDYSCSGDRPDGFASFGLNFANPCDIRISKLVS